MKSPSDTYVTNTARWFSNVFGKNNHTKETNTCELTDESTTQETQKTQKTQAEKIEALLESVNSASQHVRNFYITFLLVSFYISVII